MKNTKRGTCITYASSPSLTRLPTRSLARRSQTRPPRTRPVRDAAQPPHWEAADMTSARRGYAIGGLIEQRRMDMRVVARI
jgi:hypothetical protein